MPRYNTGSQILGALVIIFVVGKMFLTSLVPQLTCQPSTHFYTGIALTSSQGNTYALIVSCFVQPVHRRHPLPHFPSMLKARNKILLPCSCFQNLSARGGYSTFYLSLGPPQPII